MLDIIGPAGPLMYPDQVFCYRPSGHSRGPGYNLKFMSSIWYAQQAPSCQTHIYTLLKAALRKAD